MSPAFRFAPLCLALSLSPAVVAQSPAAETLDASTIMARVATNQDRSEAERTRYVYVQHAKVSSRKGKTVMCEEVTDFRVTPTTSGSEQKLLKLDGRVLLKGSYVPYTQLDPGIGDKASKDDKTGKDDENTDIDLVEHMRKNLTDSKSKDGIGKGLFPLTTKSQESYNFQLAGRTSMNGRDCFRILFSPKDKDDFGWKGEAFIDATSYQPVLVRTTMARNIPFAVRTLLGTSVPGLGFTIVYAPQPDDTWFPVSFGTEFKLHVLFFFNREIVLSAENRDFEKTHVSSTIVGGGEPVSEPKP